MKALKLAAAGAVLIVVALGVFLVNERASARRAVDERGAETPAAGGTSVDGSKVPVSTACIFKVGDRFSYAASAQTSWRLPERLRELVGAQAAGNSSWSAELHFEVLTTAPEGAVLLARLTDVANGAEEGVGSAWLARVDRSCAVAGFARYKDTPLPAARAQQTALHELYFLVPDVESAAIDFVNGTGQARGEVVREGLQPDGAASTKGLQPDGAASTKGLQPDGAASTKGLQPGGAASTKGLQPDGTASRERATLVRHIKSYPRVWSRDMEGILVTSSSLTVRRGGSGWFESMVGLEGFTASSIDTGRVELSVVSVAARDGALDGASRLESDYVWESVLGPAQSQLRALPPADYEQRVKAMRDVSLETALQRFIVQADAKANVAAQWPDMAAYLDAHPEMIEDFTTLLVKDFEPEWKVGGFLALGQTQNPAARESLLEVWRARELPMMDRVRGSLALATRPDVGAAFAQELQGEITRTSQSADQANVARQAMLHLGVLAGTHPEKKDVQAVAHSTFQGALSTATSPHELSVIFAGIGNTGDATYLAEVIKWSEHADADYRAVVALGMRRMAVDLVEGFTVQWLRRETHPDVKREIFEVVHHQYTDAGKPVGEALLSEALKHLKQQPRILTRQSLFRILEPHAGRADVRAALRTQLKVEYELRSGLFAFVASLLSERDVQSVLVGIPSLADQFNGVSALPPSTPPVANTVESNEPPTGLMPKPPTAAELEGQTP